MHQRDEVGLKIWDLRVPPRFRGPAHEHELPFFGLLIDGWMENRYRQRPIAFHRFLSVFHPAGTVHSGTTGPTGACLLTLETTAEWTLRLDGLATLPSEPAVVAAEDGAWVARRLLRELRDPQPCSRLVLEGLALDLLAGAARARLVSAGAAPRWFASLLDRLHDELDRPVTLQRLAAELGVHPARLSAVFRRHTGRTLGEYRRELQVRFVQQRLADRRHAEEPLATIALAAGFADQAHCTRVFKAVTGWTPGRYRAARRGGELTA